MAEATHLARIEYAQVRRHRGWAPWDSNPQPAELLHGGLVGCEGVLRVRFMREATAVVVSWVTTSAADSNRCVTALSLLRANPVAVLLLGTNVARVRDDLRTRYADSFVLGTFRASRKGGGSSADV